MEVESQDCPESQGYDNLTESIIKQLERNTFNLKKAILVARKVEDRDELMRFLVNFSEGTSVLNKKINVYHLLIELCAIEGIQKDKSVECFLWVFNQIYKLRRQIDSSFLQLPQKLTTLNTILRLVYQIFNRVSKDHQHSHEEMPILSKINSIIGQYQLQKSFESLPNVMFTLNMLSKIDHISQLLTQQHENLIKYYIGKLQELFPDENRAQEMVISAMARWVDRFSSVISNFSCVLSQASFYIQLSALNKLRLYENLLFVLDRCECSDEDEFELICIIVQKYFSSCSPDIRNRLCVFWTKNCYQLLQNASQTNLTLFLSELPEQLLINFVRIINNELNGIFSGERVILLSIWRALLVDSSIKQYILKHKGEFKSVELILYKYIRQIIGELESSLNMNERHEILKVYSHYFECMLQQQECMKLRTTLVHLFISNYSELIKPVMLLREEFSKNMSKAPNKIEISYLNEMLLSKILETNEGMSNIFNYLTHLNKEVGIIMIKYLSSKQTFDINQIYQNDKLLEYIIENNIELHNDKIDYLLYEKMFKNTQKYIKLIRHQTNNNIYEKKLNSFIVNLLINELNKYGKVKLLPVGFQILIYIVEKLGDIHQTALKENINPAYFINCLYKFSVRNLYSHAIDAISMLILGFFQLKQQNFGIICQEEENFVDNLVKFCCQYIDHPSYCLLGLTSILIMVQKHTFCEANRLGEKLTLILVQNDFFLTRIILLLENKNLIKHKSFNFQRKESQIDQSTYHIFWQSFRKILIYSLMKNIENAAKYNLEKYQNQINTIRQLIYDCLQSETSGCSSIKMENEHGLFSTTTMIKKRQITWDDESLEVDEYQLNKVKHQGKSQKKNNTFLSNILEKYQQFDEFKSLKQIENQLAKLQIQRQIPITSNMTNILTFERVHGKVRSIRSVKK